MATALQLLPNEEQLAEEAADIVSSAVARILPRHPFFAGVLYQLKVVPDPACRTAWTDGETLGYNPHKVAREWTFDEVKGVLVHEVCHVLGLHPYRQGWRDNEAWNIACFPAGSWTGFGRAIEEVATMERQFEGDLIVVDSQGPYLEATPEHPIRIRRRGRKGYPIILDDPEWVPAQDVCVGDYVLVPKVVSKRHDAEIDLRPYVREGTDSLGRRTFSNRALKSIPLNRDVAWLIGVYVAEGSSSPHVSFSLGSHEDILARHLVEVMQACGMSATICPASGHSMVVTSGNVVFGRWLKEHCGARAALKNVPRIVLEHGDPAIRHAFLDGLARGDGYTRKLGSAWLSTVATASDRLAYDVLHLLAQDGFGGSRSVRRLKPRKIGRSWTDKETVLHGVEWRLNPRDGVRTMRGRSIRSTNRRWRADEHGIWYRVRKTGRKAFAGVVYNLSTESHTYVVNGALVHNCDGPVNAIVHDNGFVLPKGALPPVFDKYPEEIYVHPPEGGGKKPGKDGEGGAADPGCGEVRAPKGADGKPLAGAELRQKEADAKVMLDIAYNMAEAQGLLPEGLKRSRDAMHEPRIPWLALLAQITDGVSRLDYCWARPNPRFAHTGFALPSLHVPEIAKVALAPDASGSVDRKALSEISEAALGLLQFQQRDGRLADLTVVWFDVAFYPQVIEDAEELDPKGGGGTSYAAMFEYVATLEDVKAVVVATDGECDAFGVDPGLPVLWILTKENRRFKPPFGEVAWIMDR